VLKDKSEFFHFTKKNSHNDLLQTLPSHPPLQGNWSENQSFGSSADYAASPRMKIRASAIVFSLISRISLPVNV
jgi:hypothetical protein